MATPIRVEIEGDVIQEKDAAKTYIATFNYLYKKRLINYSVLTDLPVIVRENKGSFSAKLRPAKLIEGSTNLWVNSHAYPGTLIRNINNTLNRYGINGKASPIDKKGKISSIDKIVENDIINVDKFRIDNSEEQATTNNIADLPKKRVDNILKQALCIIGDSGVGKSVRIKRTLEKEGHEKLIVIMDSLWSHLLFDYNPESRQYKLTKIGAFIREANSNKHKHYTIVIDECHKNLEIVNDSLLQAISTERNEGKRFLSLNTLGDEKFNFLPKEDGNRMLPDNLGFVFISSKKDVIIEGNPDLKNRVKIIELTVDDKQKPGDEDDQQNKPFSIGYLLEKIKKEEQSEYTN